MVSWTRFNSPRFRHSLFSHSTGTSGKPRSTFPQQQPRQIVICPTTRRFVFSGQSRSSFTVPDPSTLLESNQPYRLSISTILVICRTQKTHCLNRHYCEGDRDYPSSDITALVHLNKVHAHTHTSLQFPDSFPRFCTTGQQSRRIEDECQL